MIVSLSCCLDCSMIVSLSCNLGCRMIDFLSCYLDSRMIDFLSCCLDCSIIDFLSFRLDCRMIYFHYFSVDCRMIYFLYFSLDCRMKRCCNWSHIPTLRTIHRIRQPHYVDTSVGTGHLFVICCKRKSKCKLMKNNHCLSEFETKQKSQSESYEKSNPDFPSGDCIFFIYFWVIQTFVQQDASSS